MADNDDEGFFSPPTYKRYALSGKIMLGAIIILLFIVVLMICFHLYVRLYLFPSGRRRSRRRPRVVARSVVGAGPARRLPDSVVKSLPVFVYSPETHPSPMDCAVCLSELERNDTVRVIPNCNHSFHVGCIDMWFYSHSTCPLCRSEVEPPVEVVVICNEPGPSSGSGGSLPAVEFPAAAESAEGGGRHVGEESGQGSGKTTMKFVKSLSLKRILSRERREGVSGSAAEMEREREKEEMEMEGTRSVS